MPYSSASASIHYWYPIPWQVPTWQQIVVGLPALPPSLYMPAILALPLYSLNTLLLDTAALAVPNVLVGAFVTVGMGIMMWFINRNSSMTDASNKRTEEAVRVLTALVTEVRLERKEDRLLTSYLKERQDKLETENSSLRHSVQAFDTFIAVQVAAKKQQEK